MASKPPQATSDARLGCILAVIVGIGLLFWATSQKDLGTTPPPVTGDAGGNLALVEQPETASPPLPLNPRAARRGYAQFQKLAAASVPGSSEIFSRNCYEALAKPFDWRQLDRCGAFDALAARWTTENEDVAGEDDLAYFQSETAATRFLQAATGAGLPAQAADERWASLQAMAGRIHLARKSPPADDGLGDAEVANPDDPATPDPANGDPLEPGAGTPS